MPRWQQAALAGILAMAGCIFAVAWSNARETSNRRQDLERETRVVARQLTDRVRSGLEKQIATLEQMANFFSSSRKVTEKEFGRFAATTLRMSPSCAGVAFIDPYLRARRAYPPGLHQFTLGLDPRARLKGYETVSKARRSRIPVLSPPLDLVGGHKGFVLAAPILPAGQFLGTLVGTFRSSDYFESMLLPEVTERYELAVLDAGMPLYTGEAIGPPDPVVPSAVEEFSLGGDAWEVRVRPKGRVVRRSLESGRTALWTLGWLLAIAAGALASTGTYWAIGMIARLRSQDVALREARDRLDGTKEQLIQAEKMTALGELIAGVAHEVNNPLASIIGYTQLLMLRDIKQDIRRRLETIAREANRMAKIVSNLLAFARKHAPEKSLLGLNGIVEKTLELKAYHLRVSQIHVVKDLASDLPPTLLDFHQIQQVLLNLLNNAEQAIAETGRGGTIRLATRPVNGRIELRISDDGPGVPAEVQERIFEPFFTTKKEGKGTGLGLSLCYGIIQEHGGTIRVESRIGEGATFVIELPILREAPAAIEEIQAGATRQVPPLRVLVVDDEQSMLEFMVELLKLRGHRVDTAEDVPQALRKIADSRHDLIITDVVMPHGTGLDIYRAAYERMPRLARRIVFMTGHAADEETVRFLSETGNELILKPFEIEEIEGAIARAVRN